MAADQRIHQFAASNTEAVMDISEKEVARRQLRLVFDEMQHSSGVAKSWYEENMTQMRSSWQAER
eukprot:11190996-Lingulodinium_polyedra.AAC.1